MIGTSIAIRRVHRGITSSTISSNYRKAAWISTRTKPSLEKITVKVPTMGDAITEGTVVEWVKSVGGHVAVDDVVALVETDKVTVEIKADVEGKLLNLCAAVDETVEVGAPLYELDSDVDISQLSATGKSSDVTQAEITNEDEKPLKIPSASKTSKRVPSIHFLGRAGWAARRTVQDTIDEILKPVGQIESLEAPAIDPFFGRPMFTDEEMEAIELGGVNVSPKLIKYSSGAKFM